MHIKHLVVSGAACLMAAGAFAVPAYAHHGGEYHGCQGRVSAYTEVCSFEDCSETGIHYHGRTAYCGYDHDGGICDGSCMENGCGRSLAEENETKRTGVRMGHHGHCR